MAIPPRSSNALPTTAPNAATRVTAAISAYAAHAAAAATAAAAAAPTRAPAIGHADIATTA